MMQGRLIGVVGPSGVGKDTVMAALAKAEPRLGLVRRTITRDPSAGGEDYDPVTPAEFDALVQQDAFLVHWGAHNLRYGIPNTVRATLNAGQDLLVNLSRSVLGTCDTRVPRFVVLSLHAHPAALAKRLSGRGRESQTQITQRLARIGAALPETLNIIELDNSGALEGTVTAARAQLFPEVALQ
ncbi:MAG: phosphonate metabolism protein/1,5-bisphosphokinase (PRPP-forming) PhnN [Pseudomonadota bacterium]